MTDRPAAEFGQALMGELLLAWSLPSAVISIRAQRSS